MNERKHRYRLAGLLAAAVVATSCSVAKAQGPPGKVERVWGVLWYLRNTAEIDDLTLVYGGTEGSACLVMRDYPNQKSHWVFVHGTKMYLCTGPTMPQEKTTTVRGRFITSEQGFQFSAEKEGDRRDLSFALADIHNYEQEAATGYQIRHTPFLKGKGWVLQAASRQEAERVCAAMGLTLVVPSGGPQVGRVVTQVPQEGDPIEGATPATVTVTLDGSTVAAPIPVPGGGWASPVLIVDDDGDGVVMKAAEMTPYHSNALTSTINTGTRADLFFKLPAAAEGKLVTVTQWKRFDRLVLSAWQLQSGTLAPIPWMGAPQAAVVGHTPELKFVAPASDTFVMAEFFFRDIGDVSLKFVW